MNTNNLNNTEIEIDIIHLVRLLLQKVWVIIICMVLCGALFFGCSALLIKPRYQANAKMYVNNSSLSLGGTSFSISSSELSAARSLLDVYVIILKSRTTMEMVIEEAGLDCDYHTLTSMVSAASIDGTEVFEIVAESTDPVEAELIVDTITQILPGRIAEIVDGSSVRIVDDAVLPIKKSSPNNTKNGVIGAMLGVIASCAVIIVLDLMDTTVRDEDYVKERYDLPILAAVPDLYSSKRQSKYYSSYYGDYRKSDDRAKEKKIVS